jgi:solute carrier family 5 (sodium-coupled monocarboxylate transporter), member 8/12
VSSNISALIGGVLSLSIMSTITIMAQTSIASGELSFETKPVSVEGCTYSFLNVTKPHSSTVEHKGIHHMSYLYYTPVGMMLAIIFGNIACLFVGRLNPKDIDPALLAPFIRKYITPRQLLSVQPDVKERECIIHAFEVNDNQVK